KRGALGRAVAAATAGAAGGVGPSAVGVAGAGSPAAGGTAPGAAGCEPGAGDAAGGRRDGGTRGAAAVASATGSALAAASRRAPPRIHASTRWYWAPAAGQGAPPAWSVAPETLPSSTLASGSRVFTKRT